MRRGSKVIPNGRKKISPCEVIAEQGTGFAWGMWEPSPPHPARCRACRFKRATDFSAPPPPARPPIENFGEKPAGHYAATLVSRQSDSATAQRFSFNSASNSRTAIPSSRPTQDCPCGPCGVQPLAPRSEPGERRTVRIPASAGLAGSWRLRFPSPPEGGNPNLLQIIGVVSMKFPLCPPGPSSARTAAVFASWPKSISLFRKIFVRRMRIINHLPLRVVPPQSACRASARMPTWISCGRRR